MNIMVTGSGGQLGSEFRAMASAYPQWNFFFFSHQELDVADEAMVAETMSRCGCDVVINCAAFTSVDKAEADPERSFRVNRDGAGVLAGCAAARGALLVHFQPITFLTVCRPDPTGLMTHRVPLVSMACRNNRGRNWYGTPAFHI